VLEWNGDLYVCDHFVYPHWRLGNLHERPLEELLASPLLERFGRLKTQLPRVCRECEFLPYCHGGCPKHYLPATPRSDPAAAEFDFQDLPEDRVNYFCEGYKMFFRHALPELKRLAASARP
jgi:uncharacterized protein